MGRTVRARKSRIRIGRVLALATSLLLIALVITLVVVLNRPQVNNINSGSFKLLPFNSSNYAAFGTGAAYIDAEGNLFYLDSHGEKQWGFKGAQSDMSLIPAESRLGIKSNKKLQVVSDNGELAFSCEFKKDIFDVKLSPNISLVRFTDNDDIIVLDKRGQTVDTITSGLNKRIINCGIFGEDASSIWILTIDTGAYTPVYQVATYKYDGTSKTQTVTFENDEQMLYNALFCKNSIYLCGMRTLSVGDNNGNITASFGINGYEFVSGCDSKNDGCLLFKNDSERVFAVSAQKTGILECDEPFISVFADNGIYYGFSRYFMYTYNSQTLKRTVYALPVAADEITQGNGTALVRAGESVYLLILPE